MTNFEWFLSEIVKEYGEFGNNLEKAYLAEVHYNIKRAKPIFEVNAHNIDKSFIEQLTYQYILKELAAQEISKLREDLENV